MREVSWNMPGDQLRTFVERNQKKEMDGNTPSSVSSATYTGVHTVQVFSLEGGGDDRCMQRVQGRINASARVLKVLMRFWTWTRKVRFRYNTIAMLYLVIVLCTLP